MVCEKCGATLDDGVSFCTKCGVRVDGKKQCEKCGEWLSPDVTFCPKCGTRTDGKKVCAKCGKLLDGDILFCPDCGTPVQATKTVGGAVKSAQNGNAVAADTSVHKVLTKTKTALALALAAVALLFVFLIRVDDDWLYYYFGKAYKDLKDMGVGELSTDYRLTFYLPTVLGTVTAAATLITTFVFAVLAIVKCAKQLMDKEGKSGVPWAIAAFIAYMAGVIGLYLMSTAKDVSLEGIPLGGTELDGSSIAGIVLCSILAVAVAALHVVLCGKSLWQQNTVVKTVFNLVGIGIAFIMFILLVFPSYSLKELEKVEMEGQFSPTMFLMLIGLLRLLMGEMGEDGYVDLWSVSGIVIYAVFAALLFAVTIAMVVLLLKSMMTKTSKLTSNKGSIRDAVILLVLSAVLLGLSIAGALVLQKTYEFYMSMQYVLPIVVTVFAVLNLVLACVQSSFYKKIDAAEANEQIA